MNNIVKKHYFCATITLKANTSKKQPHFSKILLNATFQGFSLS